MNVLPRDKQVTAIAALVEGCSIRATERLTGIHRDTIMRLGVQIGEGCAVPHDAMKLENHVAAVTLYAAHYNVCRAHETLQVTPAMQLGVTDHVWTVS